MVNKSVVACNVRICYSRDLLPVLVLQKAMTLFLIFLIVVIYLDTYMARLSFNMNLFSNFIMAPVFYVPVIQLAVCKLLRG